MEGLAAFSEKGAETAKAGASPGGGFTSCWKGVGARKGSGSSRLRFRACRKEALDSADPAPAEACKSNALASEWPGEAASGRFIKYIDCFGAGTEMARGDRPGP